MSIEQVNLFFSVAKLSMKQAFRLYLLIKKYDFLIKAIEWNCQLWH